MKFLRLLLALMLAISVSAVISAQDDSIELETIEIDTYGVSATVPAGWQNVAPGVYARATDVNDLTTIIVQSAPIAPDVLLGAISGQLGIAELPDAETEIETGFGTWTVYLVEIETPVVVNVTVAVTEVEGASFLVLLQSSPEEHDALRESVFTPAIESVSPLAVEEEAAEEMEDLPYIVEDVTFDNGDITLAGTLTIPEGEGEFPVVLLVSGSGAQDRDESFEPIAEIKPFREIADYLARNGIAVLRYDDRGFGESGGDFVSSDIHDFRDDASAAIDYLAERDEFSHIGIAGHSEGGAYAPEIAINNDAVDFMVSLAGPTVRIIDVSREQNQLLYAAGGADEEQLAAIDSAYAMVLSVIEAGNDDGEALRTAVADLVLAQTGQEVDDATLDIFVDQFQSPIIQSYVTYDPTPFWQNVDVPTLAIFGSLDLQVNPEQSIPMIEDMNDNITIVTIEGMNHIFQLAETGAVSEYGELEQTIMPELLETVTEWILEVTAE